MWLLRWDVGTGDRNWGYDVPSPMSVTSTQVHRSHHRPGCSAETCPEIPSCLRNGTQVNNSIYWNVSKLREYGEGMGSTFKLVKLSFAGLSLILNPSNLIPKCWIFYLLDSSWTLHKMLKNIFVTLYQNTKPCLGLNVIILKFIYLQKNVFSPVP